VLSKILTRAAFDNAITAVAATGGSTNAVLHLLAIAREAGVPLTIDDFDPIGKRTPLWADMQPGGRYSAVDLGHAGGTALVAKRLVEPGLLSELRRLQVERPRGSRVLLVDQFEEIFFHRSISLRRWAPNTMRCHPIAHACRRAEPARVRREHR
jgi:hypothetical protein